STRFLASQKLKNANTYAEEGDAIAEIKRAQVAEDIKMGNIQPANADAKEVESEPSEESEEPEQLAQKKAHFKGKQPLSPLLPHVRVLIKPVDFLVYFSEWRHAKLLIGTCMCWFLLDVACVELPLSPNPHRLMICL
ncbi:hypothetical protein H0H87_002178, partial [Tephrocybe sp. NHM501043]